jgi:outer membrane protein OmpA-like peptidoglycan-associated protein/opacity protein-like surface antigen
MENEHMFNKILTMLLAVTCLGLFVPQQAAAQTADDRNWMSFYIGHQEYDGDYVNEMLQFGVDHDIAGGIGFHRYLNSSFDADLMLTMARLDDEYAPDYFSMYMVNTNFTLNYKFSNGYIFKEESRAQPYISAGVGYSSFVRGSEPDNSTFQVPLGVGVDIPLSDNIKLALKSTYNRSFSDDIDGNTTWDSKDHDDFLVHTIGIKVRLGAARDTDGDGIPDKNDQCPTEIGSAETNGCPDRDGDLIIDTEDRCPNQAGVAAFNGCPDTDADGIADYEDACPTIAGSAENDGCPDTDADGIPDNKDNCPNVAGTEATGGCPDSDGDGVIDSQDQCPNQAGSAATNGCPDNDRDGILNAADACPEQAGVPSNDGCPVVTQEIKDTINLIFNNLIFATDKSVIHESSYDEMDQLVTLMKDNSGLLLSIEGHTDSRGTEEYNQKLSEDRANAVKNYLTDAGISSSRITAVGYGESRPIASNDTSDGQNRNRRVELKVSYQ